MFVLVAPVQAQTQKKNFRKDFEDFKNKAKKEYSDSANRLLQSTPSLFVRLGRSLVPSLLFRFQRKRK
jgi:hypothetical protein